MAWTYTGPVDGAFALAKDEVRFLLGDTTPAAPFSLTDEEIVYLLAVSDENPRLAASKAARRMATRYSRSSVASKSVGNLSLSYKYTETGSYYERLARELLTDSEGGGSIVGAGGVTEPETTPFMFGQGDFDADGWGRGSGMRNPDGYF